jgi:iron(III) transport system ATP-binding protein
MNLKLHDIWKTYPNQTVPAIQGLHLDIRPGCITALAGESGSGKTTLLRLIAGFERPDRGTITHKGRAVVDYGVFLPPNKRSVSMIFQDLALFPHLTAEANVAFAINREPRKERRIRSRTLLASVGLEGFAGKYPHELSGGQRQRVALSRALAADAETILMDEPFSNLDPELKWTLMEEIRSILLREQKTVVFVTHNQEEAFTIADDLAIIQCGKLLQHGSASEVYRKPANHAVARFFGPVNRIPTEAVNSGLVEDVVKEFLIRPGRCELVSRNCNSHCGSNADNNRIAGTVNKSRFMGEFWETEVIPDVHLELGTDRLIVREKNPRMIGEAVWVILPRAG